jgi:hypothetical protein
MDNNTGAVIFRGWLTEDTKGKATLVFIGKMTSQTRWTPLFVENESGKIPMTEGSSFYSNTLRVLDVLKGSPLEEEIVISSAAWKGSPGKTYEIYAFDGISFFDLDAKDCLFFPSELSLPDDTHGATK